MQQRHSNWNSFWRKILPVFLLIAIIVFLVCKYPTVTVDSLLQFLPQNPLFAGGCILLFYLFKGLTVFFPVTVLYVLTGYLYSPVVAVLINSTGLALAYLAGYLLGRFFSLRQSVRLYQGNEKFRKMVKKQGNHPFLLSFLLRIVNCLPGDLISMYMGSIHLPLSSFLAGSMLGAFPSLCAMTLFGYGVNNTASPIFWISLIANVLLTIASFWLWNYLDKKDAAEKPLPSSIQ